MCSASASAMQFRRREKIHPRPLAENAIDVVGDVSQAKIGRVTQAEWSHSATAGYFFFFANVNAQGRVSTRVPVPDDAAKCASTL